MKPVVNLDELSLVTHENGKFEGSYAPVSVHVGARKLGYNLSVCPPGKRICPFHNHHVNEEMFLILEGEGLLRFGDQEYPLRAHDVICCPPGGREVAHQIINTGTTNLKFFALSTREPGEIVEYPDSNKIGVLVGDFGNMALKAFFKADQTVDYFDGEAMG